MTLRFLGLVGLLVLGPAAAIAGGGDETSPRVRPGLAPVAWSPDGARIALSEDGAGLHVLDRATGEVVSLTEDPGAGYRVRFSPDGSKIAFKLFAAVDGAEYPLQVPVVYNFAAGRYERLSAPVQRAGVPCFARDGRVAFTVEDSVVVLAPSGAPVGRWSLGEYVNLVSLSPDGQYLAWAGELGLWILDLASGARVRASGRGTLYDPQWNGDGTRLLASEASGGLLVVDLAARRAFDLPRAASARWMNDGETVLFESSPVPDGAGVPAEADLRTVRYDGTGLKDLVATAGVRETSPVLSPDGAELVWRSGGDEAGALSVAPVQAPAASRPVEIASWRALDDRAPKAVSLAPFTRALATVEISGVPYLHQVYDTPDDFNGHWACGPTAAMMTVAFRSILANWDCTCSTPYKHTSHWGNYISKIYTHGRKFDIAADTATGKGYGAYGYIRNPSGFDTKGHMAEFLRYHDLDSSVDWSPTWTELKAEVDKKQPFVILTTITSSGHYKTVIGYATAQHTMVLNDPYGNKNQGYMNYNGKRVFYDWPGYSNGFANVNSVACFVYSRAKSTPAPTTGTLKGTVYKAPTTTAYISGATVTAGGKSATTNASGAFSLTLGAGTYDVVVKASGYQDGKVSKAVTAGGTATVAVGLYPAVVTGDFKGVVYEVNPADPADKTKRLTSAQVSLDGGAFKAVRATDAYFLFTTAPGPHTVKAKLTGYNDNTSSATVTGGTEIWASVGLSKTSTLAAPKLHLVSPDEGEWLDDTTFAVTGTVENAGGVSEVQVTAAGKTFKGPVANAAFAVEVTVPAGKTALEVKASNAAGSDTQTRTVNFKTGLCGIVSDEAGPVAGASAALLPVEDACGLPVATATTGADGRYCLDAADGSYSLKVVAAGHLTALDSVEVSATARETTETALTEGSDAAPSLELVGPAPGEDGKAHVSDPTVTLTWRTNGIAPVETKVNGQVVTPTDGDQEGDTVQVVAGLPLVPGENTFVIEVSGQCGAKASAAVTVVREDGPASGADAGVPVSGADGGKTPPGGEVQGGCGGCASGAGALAPLAAALLALVALGRRRTG